MNVRKRALGVVGAALLGLAGTAIAPVSAGLYGDSPSLRATAAAPIEPALLQELDAAGATGRVEVIVGATDVDAANAAIRAAGLVPQVSFPKIGFAATSGPASAVREIASRPGVTYLQGNRALRPAMTTATVATRVAQAEAAFTDVDGNELDGTGVGIAVVDSGMAGDHPTFHDDSGKTRLLNIKQVCANLLECGAHVGDEPDEYFVNATGLDTDLTALGGHGTHVTSIAGGRELTTSNGVAVRGIARNSSLYGLGAGVGILTLNAAASLNWVLEHHADPCAAFTPAPDVAGGCAPIKVVNNSYSGSPDDYDPADIFAVIGERLVLAGVTVVWAAGNGDDITSTDPRPNDGSVNLTNVPAQSPKNGILMIANYDDAGNGTRDGDLDETSSRGEEGRPETYPDFSAPGTNILAACRPYLPICTSGYADLNWGEISGTSMAAPHVAGIVALLLDARPDLTPAEIEDVLEDTAHQFGDPASYEPDTATASAPIPNQVRNDTETSFDKGHGLVDLSAALYHLAGLTDPGPSGSDPCASVTNSFTDPGGDATQLFGLETGVAPLSYAGLDVLSASITPQLGGTTRFAIKVSDLTDSVAPGATGDNYRFTFTFDGRLFELGLSREISGVGTYTTEFRLFENGLTEDVDIATGLTGGFDTVNDEVWAIVDDDAIQSVYPTSPLLHSGATVALPGVVAQRMEGAPGVAAVTPTVDTAGTTCSLDLP